MALYIENEKVVALVKELASKCGISAEDAVCWAVHAELYRLAVANPLRERIAAWREQHPMPPPTGESADKGFFDDVSG